LKLYEHETKTILKDHGIPTPRGTLAANPIQARFAATNLRPPFAVKAQVLVAGRGKSGGILFANTLDEVQEAAEKLFKAQIKGISVKKILIEEIIPIKKELYMGISIDRAERKYVLMTSYKGGVDIEEIAEKNPKHIVKTILDPKGYSLSEGQDIARRLGYENGQQKQLSEIIKRFVEVGMDYDSELIEVNPLAETEDGGFVAVDARLIIDDNAVFRHKEYQEKIAAPERENTPEETEAQKIGIAYVKLEGNIGVIGNGAGLVMSTLDMVQYFGGNPANFLDLGGGAPLERIIAALKIVLADQNVKVLLINILGGMTKCDDVARGIVDAKSTLDSQLPIVVRLMGTNEEEGKRILNEAQIQVLDSMEEAAQRAVKLAEV